MKSLKTLTFTAICTTNLLTAYSGSATVTRSSASGQPTATITGSGSRGYGTVNLTPDSTGSWGYTAQGSITLTESVDLSSGYTRGIPSYSTETYTYGPYTYTEPVTTYTQESSIPAGTYNFDNVYVGGTSGPGTGLWTPIGKNLAIYGSPTEATIYANNQTTEQSTEIGYTTGGYAEGNYTTGDSVLYMYNSDGTAVPVAYVDYTGNGTAAVYWNTAGETVPQ